MNEIDLDKVNAAARRNTAKGRSPLDGLRIEEIAAAQRQFSEFEDEADADGFLASSTHCVRQIGTPRPYLHLMASLHPRGRGIYGSFWDQTGRGFSCLDSVLAGPVTSHWDTSYVPTCPTEPDLRSFCLREEGRGAFQTSDGTRADLWFVIPQNGREEESYRDYRCEQGTGFVRIAAASRGVLGEVEAFVADDDPVEIWAVRLRNLTARRRVLTLFTRVNWGLRSYPAYYFDMRVVCSGAFDRPLNGLAAFNNDQNNRLPRSGIMMSDVPIAGFDLSREAFDGAGMLRVFPEAAVEGRCTGSTGRSPLAGMIGAIQQSVELAPRGEAVIHTLVGAGPREPADARRQMRAWKRRYLRPGGFDAARAAVGRLWRERCAANLIDTGDAEIDRFFNVWAKYQTGNTARFTRALDMSGYRDVLQDLLGICDFDPAYARQELLTALSFQLRDGRGIRQYCKFEGAKHDVRMYMDSPIWIADTLAAYVQETGDEQVLDEPVGFFHLETQTRESNDPGTVYEHALLSIRSCFDFRGQKGLCLAGHGDWNDALDGIGRGGHGVSAWLSVALVYAAQRLRALALHRGRGEDAAYLQNVIDVMTQAVNHGAWDGEWYVYGFNDKGVAIGSHQNPEGRLHLNVNSWSLLAGVAAAAGPARVESVCRAIAQLETPLGHRLLSPSYTARSHSVGRIADILPGLFENGSIYTHGQAFVTAALLSIGQGDAAWTAMKKTMPSHTLPEISTVAPHQQSNFTVGPDNPDFGKNYYSNFTGSLNWYRRNLIRMCGVMADFGGLRIDPCVPRWLKSYRVSKRFRGCRYLVEVDNAAGVSTGVASITVDGRPLEGTVVPLSASRECRVNVVMG